MATKRSTRSGSSPKSSRRELALGKTPTGIYGLDHVTGGGIPTGRPTLVCGGPGSGKSLLAIEFLVRGAREHCEPGVLISFEESLEEIAENVSSLGFDLHDLVRRKSLFMDYVHVDAAEIEETGEYDLEGLFVRLRAAVDAVEAKRIVLDTIETLFANLRNERTVRSELVRLFRWLKDRGLTAVVTGEKGEGTLTRYGLEEYVSDCVIFLDHRVRDEISTRRLRIVKYRGTVHGTNEYPFVIDESGVALLPVTALGLDHAVSSERIASGIHELDSMLGGGVYRGSSVLITGTPGTGKTSIGAHFAEATCRNKERALIFTFEESTEQIVRNLASIGVDLARWRKRGLLDIRAARPQLLGLETHLVHMQEAIRRHEPRLVVIDPVNALTGAGSQHHAFAALLRLIDSLKSAGITAILTNATSARSESDEGTDLMISSIMDTWILLRPVEIKSERSSRLFILKSRGSAHSRRVRSYSITDHGIILEQAPGGSPDAQAIQNRKRTDGRGTATRLD